MWGYLRDILSSRVGQENAHGLRISRNISLKYYIYLFSKINSFLRIPQIFTCLINTDIDIPRL